MRRRCCIACLALLAIAAPEIAPADDSGNSLTPRRSAPDQSRLSRIRFDVNLVLIPVTVTDPYERLIQDLQKNDFRVFEDSIEQQITQFFRDDSPVSVGLILDASNSMRSKLIESRKAIMEFLKLTSPGDEFFLLTFNDRPEMTTRFTTSLNEIENTLPSIQARGWTSLYDAVYLGISQIRRASHRRKVLLVFSDGNDNDSRYTKRELTEMVKEADVRIFAISILDRSRSLEELCEESGGRAYRVRKLDQLPALAARISEELHSEYVLGYVPMVTDRDGKYRHIRVQLAKPPTDQLLHVSWRHGYYSPVE